MGELIRWKDLVERGLTRQQISAALGTGELRKLRRGVYATGSTAVSASPAVPERWLVELHAAGPDARLAGAAAARLLRLDGFDDAPAALLIEVPARSTRRGTHVRRVTDPGPLHHVEGLPVASVERTLLGLGAGLAPRPGCRASSRVLPATDLVELAVESALRSGLTSVTDLAATLSATGRRTPGRSVLAHVLARRPPGAPATESYLETRMVQVLRDAGLPDPQRQVDVTDHHGHHVARVDLLLGRAVLETDGWEHHHTPDELAADHQRTNRLHALGFVVGRFTFDQVEHQPRWVGEVIETIATAPAPARHGG